MGLEVGESLKILKPLRSKLVKKLDSKDAQANWNEFIKLTDSCIDELTTIESMGTSKARVEYEAKKSELEALKKAINASSAKAMNSWRKALNFRNLATNQMAELGKKMKDSDPAFKDYRAGFVYQNNALGRFPDMDLLGPVD